MPNLSSIATIRLYILAALLLPTPSFGQEPSDAVTQDVTDHQEESAAVLTAKAIQGLNLWDRDSELLGEVDDVILDRETSRLRMVVISLGGFLGIGSKAIAIDWTEIDYDPRARLLRTRRLTAEDLKQLGVIDSTVPEPVGGAHRDVSGMIDVLGNVLEASLRELLSVEGGTLKARRRERFLEMGRTAVA